MAKVWDFPGGTDVCSGTAKAVEVIEAGPTAFSAPLSACIGKNKYFRNSSEPFTLAGL